MNRFRTKKKARDDVSAPRPSQDSESSMPFRPFRKGKKVQEPEKVEIDLSTALPSTDEFRTSLLMTGLSARFSMLREQDDPNTKIGKASDDSVLFPKRQSKMDYGGFRGLGDIAEVESIKIAAPFARKDSYNSDDADSMTASSIMGRSKATEGNNLFGGRQKIYKIPAGASSKTGGVGGRILYDDDVALSAFQKWRQAEKDRKSTGDELDDNEERESGDMESEALRADSPILSNYNQKRETSSTTSSFPSMARNSTAATSVASSHRAPSLKDWQLSASSTPALEKNVTRTRRLYESGLNTDLHEQQSSALSRIDTLTRQRTFGTRTPDLATNSPSPTTVGFAERFSNDRKVLAKSSAPNLRSMSPPATASSVGTMDPGVRVPSASEIRPNFGGAPPLSPPISETEENSVLLIHPSDRGKATALGVFQKPSQPYDESRYAQRQLQRQQGRETPTQRSRDELNPSSLTNRSSSSSSIQRKELESRAEAASSASGPRLNEDTSTSFLADPNDSDSSPAASPKPSPSPRVLLRRPSDREHPAFRESVIVPPPLSVTGKSSGEPSPVAENSSSLSSNPKGVSPIDSPTLGPAADAGLSGMVRQHLRGDSNASSIYSGLPTTSGLESRFPLDPDAALAFQDLGKELNPWDLPDAGRDWTLDLDVNEPMPDALSRSSNVPNAEDLVSARPDNKANTRDDGDEFADQLANGARRVRERLTTYVESDSRSASPHRTGDSSDLRDQSLPPRQNGLGLLHPKSSRGSLIDRGRETSQPKTMKTLGMGPPNSAPPAVPVREPKQEEQERENSSFQQTDLEDRANGSEEPNAGLRAFRQARRELQKMKELETQTQHHQRPSGSIHEYDSSRSTPSGERPSKQRSPNRDRKPPPILYQQRTPSEESRKEAQHSESWDQSRSDRDRSGSDSSNGMRSNSRPARPMNSAGGRGNLQIGPNGTVPRPPMRSPGLPGTDIKRSPIMPPQPYPGSSKSKQSNLAPNSNLHVQTSRNFEAGHPSPISPIPSPYAANGPSTPVNTLPSSPRPTASPNFNPDIMGSSGNDAMRRKIKPKDISDPTLVMSTSRVPTVTLSDAPRNRSRSNSRTAPPLPPINPRRRQDFSSTRAVFDNLSRRNGEGIEGEASASMPNLSYGKSANRDDDPRPERRRLRPMASEAQGLNSRMPNNAPPINIGPPASRQVVTQGAKRPGMGLPGGMI